MSLHKLTAGSGYDYLTRQVAALDSTEKGHASLASYYSEKGEIPGVWIGAGLEGIDGLNAGDAVSAEQMKALFAYGFHPLADERIAALENEPSEAEVRGARQLGTPFKVYEGDVPPFVIEVARRIEDLNVAAGQPPDASVDVEVQARVRSEVACEYFERDHGREPADARELAATVAKLSRPKTTAVAGYDLTFSPVKSVSTLWALADPQTAAKIELAHQAAIRDALAFLEKETLYTRTGTHGVQQVDVTGLIATAFTHRDSRAGDPDLHTHVAVANKVQTLDGKWLAIDGRILFKANVSASEKYNTALENHLYESLGIRFEERRGQDPRKRPVREIVGIDPRINELWSSRRASIEDRRDELVTRFQTRHGRPPTPVESIQLAQQATLETREAKHEARSLAEQRHSWRDQAEDLFGDPAFVDQMVTNALFPTKPARTPVTADWVATAASNVVAEVQSRMSTWQVWHLRAEAERQIRGVEVTTDRAEALVSLIIEHSIDRSIRLATDRDAIRDPEQLRRIDGTSVFHVAGSDRFTSQAVLDAEQRITAAAGEFDGHRIREEAVDLALLESAANDVELNPGQAALVRELATSGARVQLGIAAAGTGKTTALGVLTRAWEEPGGNVIGLAPSATSATQLRGHIGTTTDTLAKLIHAIETGTDQHIPRSIGPETLVLIDEAGMADTLSLDKAILFALQQGASVRLIGDYQQLATIGAGGVLRDIDTQHGATRLSELMRFDDPAEGAASLALRDGLPEGLGHYLDRNRIHVGDLATETDDVFTHWASDRAVGLDSIMLAPTRDLVAELNARARTARLTNHPGNVDATVRLADGNQASVGDVVITRHNDRRLSISATDWVKNGDRWHVTEVHNGRLSVVHARTGLHQVLPAEYVTAHTELGYASTVHTAQGISVDTMHGLATGDETRQQFYTMMTRGRLENHVYVVTANDGDPHNLIRPETIHPKTATDVLEGVLARDGSPKSATTMADEANSPATQLSQAAPRYIAALYSGAQQLIGDQKVGLIDATADELVPGISDEPAWPALRAHLHLLEAQGQNCLQDLALAVAERELTGAEDRAAILDWRLDPTGHRGTQAGPLPWLPAIPDALAADKGWGPYLSQRALQVEQAAAQVREPATGIDTPLWARHGGARPSDELLAEVAVWRAANGVDDTDRRPTGPPQLQKAAAVYQRRLADRVNTGRTPALIEWGPTIDAAVGHRDAFTALLAERLAAVSRTRLDASALFRTAVAEGPLPDDHGAAAIWWRINRHLSPAVAADATGHDNAITTDWADLLVEYLGNEAASRVTASSYWPTLVASIDRATHLGWAIPDLLAASNPADLDGLDLAQALVWRIAILTDPPPEHDSPEFDPPPADLETALTPTDPLEQAPQVDVETVADRFNRAAFDRGLLEPFAPSERDIAKLVDRAFEWDHSPISGERIFAINELATDYYEAQLRGSWAQKYLHMRFGQDLAGDERFRPGYAPAGWTNLVDHLRSQRVSDEEMLAAGVAKTASTAHLIDRFRDRVMLPVTHNGQVLGFAGRRHPDAVDGSTAGPKYLNTPDTIVFHKGAQLFGIADPEMALGSIPVLVEGPLDAIAVTVATAGAFIGVTPLGTSLTSEQAARLAKLGAHPIVATDGDLAGRIAAERDYWRISPHGVEPQFVQFNPGADPASVLARSGPAALTVALQNSTLLAESLVNERIINLRTIGEQVTATADIIAAQPPGQWLEAANSLARRIGVDPDTVLLAVADSATQFNDSRTQFSTNKVGAMSDVRARMERAQNASPAERWANFARSVDNRLQSQRDWPATASMIQDVHDAGHDAADLVRQAVIQYPLGELPAQDLRYRLVGYLPERERPSAQPHSEPTTDGAEKLRRDHTSRNHRPGVGPRR